MQIAEWMETSGVAFGTSGARGLVNSMTDKVCFAYTLGFLQHLRNCNEFSPGAHIAIAGDLRPSTGRILCACVAAIRHAGGQPVFCGYVPTPALCHYSYTRGIPSLMVTGSHIPDDRNGIKFNRARGEFLKSDEARMKSEFVTINPDAFDEAGMLRNSSELPPAIDVLSSYVFRYQSFFGDDALAGYRLGVYQHSAVGRDVLVDILEAIGANVTCLGRTNTFAPVDTEAVRPADIALARDWAAGLSLDALLTTDGDSDRPLLADENGSWLRGDILGILAARFLGAHSVTTPVSSNTALELAGFAADMRRTRIGSPYVIEAMLAAVRSGLSRVVGYEANGGFLLADDIIHNGRHLAALLTRDAVLPMLSVLIDARQRKATLSELQNTLPPRFTASDRIEGIPPEVSRDFLDALTGHTGTAVINDLFQSRCGHIDHVDVTDGFRMTFSGTDIVHLRPSGNAPELRVYVESGSPLGARELLASTLDKLAPWKNTHSTPRQDNCLGLGLPTRSLSPGR